MSPSAMEADRRGAARQILVNTVYRTVADLGSKLATIGLYIVIARKLGDAHFGVYAFAFSFSTLVTTLGTFGQQGILTREVARDHGKVHRYFANTASLNILLAAPALAIAVTVLALGHVVDGSLRGETLVVVTLIGLAAIFDILTDTCMAVYQAYERMAFIPVVLISQRLAMAAAAIPIVLLGGSVEVVAAIYLATSVLAATLAFAILRRRVVPVRLDVDRRTWWPLMKAAFPVGMASVFMTVLFRADMTMLAFFTGPAVVGNYGAAYRLLESTLFVSWSVGTAVLPVFSRLTRKTEPPVRLVFERSLKLVVGLLLPVALGAAVLGPVVIRFLYGSDFQSAGQALQLLAPTIVLYPVSYIAGMLLVAQDRQRVLTIVYAALAIENIVANLILIPRLSLFGAAIGTATSELLVAGALVVAAVNAVGRVHWPRALSGPLIAGSVCAIAMFALRRQPLVAIALGGGAYVGVLAAFEWAFFRKDAMALFDLVRRRTA